MNNKQFTVLEKWLSEIDKIENSTKLKTNWKSKKLNSRIVLI